jgi:pimeloyl-ACP methyl ester carboxylesterase
LAASEAAAVQRFEAQLDWATGATMPNRIVITTHDACHQEVDHLVEVGNSIKGSVTFKKIRLQDQELAVATQPVLDVADGFAAVDLIRRAHGLAGDDTLLLIVEANLRDDEDDEYFLVTAADCHLGAGVSRHSAIVSLFYLDPRSAFMTDGTAWWSSLGDERQRVLRSNSILNLMVGALAADISPLGWHKDTRGCIMDYCQNPMDLVRSSDGRFEFCARECDAALTGDTRPFLLALAARLTDASDVPKRWRPRAVSAPPIADGAQRETVVSLHGIRTRGKWQKDLAAHLARAGFVPESLDYGFFRALELLVPALREKQVDWFRDEYTRIVRGQTKPPSVVAHSFGTYIVANALVKYREIRVNRLVLCGSIVSESYPWSQVAAQVTHVLNDYGHRDIWAKAVGWAVRDAGASGAVGFTDVGRGLVEQQCRRRFRHSDYFFELHYQNCWIPFLKGTWTPDGPEPADRGHNWRFAVTLWVVGVAATIGTLLLAWLLTRP